MIKYNSNNDEEGIHLIENRFTCCLSKRDKVFKEGRTYRKNLEIGLILSLMSLIFIFQVWKKVEEKEVLTKGMNFVLHVEDIPQTVQHRRSPAPSRPSVPIASEDEDVPEDETIELTDFDFVELPPPPPPPPEEESDILPFIPFDEPPVPIGGYAALHKNLVYPEIARLAGINGIVVLGVHVDREGNVQDIKILKSLMDLCDEAAIRAVRSVKWKPAKQRDMPASVWISVRLIFQLEKDTNPVAG